MFVVENKNIMNDYLTEIQEQKVYDQIMNHFESNHGECTNCESNYIIEDYNYFMMFSEKGEFKIRFKIRNGILIKRTIITTQL